MAGLPDALPTYGRLLLSLAQLDLDDQAVETCRRLAMREDMDWGAFVDAAARHRLLPLVGRHVGRYRLDRKRDGVSAVPYPWLFTYAYMANRQRNLALADEFARLLWSLNQRGVRYAVRKGFVLGEYVYHDPAVRRMADFDILLDRADANTAHEVLTGLGYVQGYLAEGSDIIVRFSRSTQVFWRVNLSNQLPYVKTGNRPDVNIYSVDLCHNIFQPRYGVVASTPEMLGRARRLTLCGESAWALGRHDALVDLCSHLYKEATSLLFIEEGTDLQLSKFLDLALACGEFDDPDWNQFLSLVNGYGAAEIAFYALHFTTVLYPLAVPGQVLDQLRPADVSYLDDYGTLDGRRAQWTEGFPGRLFNPRRGQQDIRSSVPRT